MHLVQEPGEGWRAFGDDITLNAIPEVQTVCLGPSNYLAWGLIGSGDQVIGTAATG